MLSAFAQESEYVLNAQKACNAALKGPLRSQYKKIARQLKEHNISYEDAITAATFTNTNNTILNWLGTNNTSETPHYTDGILDFNQQISGSNYDTKIKAIEFLSLQDSQYQQLISDNPTKALDKCKKHLSNDQVIDNGEGVVDSNLQKGLYDDLAKDYASKLLPVVSTTSSLAIGSMANFARFGISSYMPSCKVKQTSNNKGATDCNYFKDFVGDEKMAEFMSSFITPMYSSPNESYSSDFQGKPDFCSQCTANTFATFATIGPDDGKKKQHKTMNFTSEIGKVIQQDIVATQRSPSRRFKPKRIPSHKAAKKAWDEKISSSVEQKVLDRMISMKLNKELLKTTNTLQQYHNMKAQLPEGAHSMLGDGISCYDEDKINESITKHCGANEELQKLAKQRLEKAFGYLLGMNLESSLFGLVGGFEKAFVMLDKAMTQKNNICPISRDKYIKIQSARNIENGTKRIADHFLNIAFSKNKEMGYQRSDDLKTLDKGLKAKRVNPSRYIALNFLSNLKTPKFSGLKKLFTEKLSQEELAKNEYYYLFKELIDEKELPVADPNKLGESTVLLVTNVLQQVAQVDPLYYNIFHNREGLIKTKSDFLESKKESFSSFLNFKDGSDSQSKVENQIQLMKELDDKSCAKGESSFIEQVGKYSCGKIGDEGLFYKNDYDQAIAQIADENINNDATDPYEKQLVSISLGSIACKYQVSDEIPSHQSWNEDLNIYEDISALQPLDDEVYFLAQSDYIAVNRDKLKLPDLATAVDQFGKFADDPQNCVVKYSATRYACKHLYDSKACEQLDNDANKGYNKLDLIIDYQETNIAANERQREEVKQDEKEKLQELSYKGVGHEIDSNVLTKRSLIMNPDGSFSYANSSPALNSNPLFQNPTDFSNSLVLRNNLESGLNYRARYSLTNNFSQIYSNSITSTHTTSSQNNPESPSPTPTSSTTSTIAKDQSAQSSATSVDINSEQSLPLAQTIVKSASLTEQVSTIKDIDQINSSVNHVSSSNPTAEAQTVTNTTTPMFSSKISPDTSGDVFSYDTQSTTRYSTRVSDPQSNPVQLPARQMIHNNKRSMFKDTIIEKEQDINQIEQQQQRYIASLEEKIKSYEQTSTDDVTNNKLKALKEEQEKLLKEKLKALQKEVDQLKSSTTSETSSTEDNKETSATKATRDKQVKRTVSSNDFNPTSTSYARPVATQKQKVIAATGATRTEKTASGQLQEQPINQTKRATNMPTTGSRSKNQGQSRISTTPQITFDGLVVSEESSVSSANKNVDKYITILQDNKQGLTTFDKRQLVFIQKEYEVNENGEDIEVEYVYLQGGREKIDIKILDTNLQEEIRSLDEELEKQVQEQEVIQETKLSKLIADIERYKIEAASLKQEIDEIINPN